MTEKEKAIEQIVQLPEEQVAKVLIFMAGLEAGKQAAAETAEETASDTTNGKELIR